MRFSLIVEIAPNELAEFAKGTLEADEVVKKFTEALERAVDSEKE